MPATPQDRLYGLTTSVAVKPPVYISADYDITRFGEQTITSKTPTDERTITTTEGMRVLLLGQDNPVENGIWVARRSFWVRATDFNGPRDAVNGTLVFSINGDCWQVEADDPVVIGKSAIHFRPTYPFEANLDIFQRTLRVPEASVNVLPSAEDRAWKGLGFDGAGQPKLQDPAGTGLWGYVPAIGSFEKGSLLTQRFEVLLWESTDEYWRWDGAMPKIVLPGSTPDTAGGRGKGKWLDVTDATLRSNLGSGEPGMGGSLVAFAPAELGDQITTVNQALSAQAPTIWQYARHVIDRPTVFPSTWDWGPAFQAAHDNDNVGPLLINGETYTVRTPVIYEYTDDDYLKYSRLPRCPTGFAIIDYSGLGNGGTGFNDALEVDDAAQPAYVPAFTVKGASGYVVLQEFEGIVFRGNKNTAAIKLIGCDGVRPNRCIFTSNRYGVVFNNGNASGTYAELNAPVFCRWRGGCLTAIAYEKGSGDTSFHGCGLGGDCHVTVTAGRSPVLIGAGCQPYNAPMNANFWMSGVSAPLIQNKGMTAHFHGNLKLEGSFKTVLSAGAKVYFYGPISTWSGVDKGTLTQAVRGGATGPRAGNLDFSGITEPQITRWDIAAAGSVVAFAGYNEEAVVTVRGSTLSCTFKITTGRHKTDRAVSAPVVVIYGNFNPITRFNIKGTVSGLSLTTAEDNTIIVARRVGGLPDESSGNNFSTADYWRTE
ncbi:hypothetical protein ACKUSK_17575 [Klebsiella oxytoca]